MAIETIGAVAALAGAASSITSVVEALQRINTRREANIIRPVNGIVRSLGTDLRIISHFIKDLQWLPAKNNAIKEIIRQMGSSVRDGQDAISRYEVYLTRHNRRNRKEKILNGRKHTRKLAEVAEDAQKVEEEISRALQNFDNMLQRLTNILKETNVAALLRDAEAENELQKLRSDVEENVVGFVHDCKDLVVQLIKGDSERRVISITGMGGADKTTLAKKIYNDKQIISHFDSRAWIDLEKENTDLVRQIVRRVVVDPWLENLKGMGSSSNSALKRKSSWEFYKGIKEIIRPSSKNFSILEDSLVESWKFSLVGKDVLKKENLEKIENQTSEYLSKTKDETLKEILSNHLNGKKYLIVLDNVWDTETWNKVKEALPADQSGECRILITTRVNRVALYANSSRHAIRKLDPTESLALFCKHLFRKEKFDEGEEAELETACEKLFRENECSEIEKGIINDLAQSCQGLPLSIAQLADFLAGTERTSERWSEIGDVNSYLAENKPRCKDSLALSYHRLPRHLKQCLLYFAAFPKYHEIPVRQLIQFWIAEEFIKEDRRRNIEDTAEHYLKELIDESLIQPSTWRLDGVKTCVMHGLMQEVCMSEIEEMFLEVHTDAKSLSRISSKPLIVSLQGKASSFKPSECHGLSSVRSFLSFQEGALSMRKSQLKGLCRIIELVRVLNLGDVELKSIPEAIGELNQLRYLKLKGAQLKVIPDSIHKLWNLLTLDLRGSAVKSLPKGIWKLQDLRHLYLSEPTKLPQPPSPEHNTLNNLQVLSGLFLNEQSVQLIASERFPYIRKLRVYGSNRRVNGKSHKIQANIWQNVSFLFLTSLTKMTLVDVTMDSGLTIALGGLPNLLILKILRGQSSNDIDALLVTEGFVKLRDLQLAHFPIKNFILQWNAMKGLHRLIIKECNNLKMLQLHGLNNLKEVRVHGCSPELTTMLEEMRKEGRRFKIVSDPAQETANQRN